MRSSSFLCAALLLLAAPTSAQEPGQHPPGPIEVVRVVGGNVTAAGPLGGPSLPGVPNFLGHLFPPQLVMRFQTEIDLSSAQRKAISAAMHQSYERVVEAQWDIQAASEQLKELLEGSRVDESAALAQIDRVMKAEQQLKRSHIALLIRVKNQLEPEQQARLRELGPNPRAYFAAPARMYAPPGSP